MKNNSRKELHKKNVAVESILEELEYYFRPIQDNINQNQNIQFNKPVVFIVGCARSGTTVLFQYLANEKIFCYPNNLISRFYYSPYIGAKIHQLLITHDDKKELFNNQNEFRNEFISNLGKTKGADAPHEFWYFWKRYFKFKIIQKLTEKELENIDWENFLKDLVSIQNIFEKPMLLKAMILNWNLKALSEKIPNSYFLFIKRDILYNAQSLLLARKAFFEDETQWYSFKPPEYDLLRKLSPEEQVVKQVQYTNKAIYDELKDVPGNRKLFITYESFCNNPTASLAPLIETLNLDWTENPKTVKLKNEIKIDLTQWEMLKKYV